MADETQMDNVLTPDDLAGLLTDSFRHELLYIPEWRKSVWVWAYTLEGERSRWGAMETGKDQVDKVHRGMIARVIEAVRVSGEANEDGSPPEKLFHREKHWQMLLDQPAAVIRRICEKSEQLNGERGVTQEQMQSFFAMQASMRMCLARTASASGSCTDCPANSQAICPSVLSESLWLPTQ